MTPSPSKVRRNVPCVDTLEPASPCSGTVSEAWYVVHAEAETVMVFSAMMLPSSPRSETVTGIALSDRTRIQAVKS